MNMQKPILCRTSAQNHLLSPGLECYENHTTFRDSLHDRIRKLKKECQNFTAPAMRNRQS